MAEHRVSFDVADAPVTVPTGTLIVEAAQQAGLDIQQPCGGQGRCGRCVVKIDEGTVRQRSSLRLSNEDIAAGFVLACQAMIEGDISITIPPQEKIKRRLSTDRTVKAIHVPKDYDPRISQTLQRFNLSLSPPSMDDQTDDWSRLQTALRQQAGVEHIQISLKQVRQLGQILREGDWTVTAVLDSTPWDCPGCPACLIDLKPGHTEPETPLWGAAIDIGTTTISLWLVNLRDGEVNAQLAEYNGQISRGEDVISRIIYSTKSNGSEELSRLVRETINSLIETACKRVQAAPGDIMKATLAGNSTMLHLLLGIPAESIRLSPFVTAINHVPPTKAKEIGLNLHPEATVDCLPGVASYVGADISAGALSSGLDDAEDIALFIDIGTNGETVLGNKDWLVTCACSAGPAFEGGGVLSGMRATQGAIEEVWINATTFDPTYRVIGGTAPRGLCGSGLISLLAEMFLTGVIDKGGNVNLSLSTPRTRVGEHGAEYVVAWASETAQQRDMTITHVDIDNLLRAKAAIYAGFTILAERVGIPLESVSRILVGGSFGQYINVEKAIEIGLLPDMPWDSFHFRGNTSVRGAYLALLDHQARARIRDIASCMTYIELSADNTFYDAFTSALFLPHTDLTRFPSVQTAI